MGFAGWGRRCELVIQSSQVDQDCTDFPVLVHEDSLPSEIFDADGSYPALNGGGDLRFSTDQAGDSRLPCEVESFVTDNDPALGKSAVWVKRTLSSASNTSIWVFYNKSGETQPAETDAYGKHAVWDSNFVMVQHMAETPPGTIVDSTSNSNDGTTSGMDSADQVAGQIDGSLDFDGVDDGVKIDDNPSLDITGDITISFWYNSRDSVTDSLRFVHKYQAYSLFQDMTDNALRFLNYNDFSFGISTAAFVENEQQLVTVVKNIDVVTFYRNNIDVSNDTSIGAVLGSSAIDLTIGISNNLTSLPYNGLMDEVRISNVARTAGWIATEYNNQYAPGTFLVEGVPESPGVGVTIPIFMQNMRGGYNLMSRGGFIN